MNLSSEAWQTLPAAAASIDRSAIHVIRVAVGAGRERECSFAELSADELSRAERYVVEPPRRRFLLCRRALRCALGWLTATPPADVRFGSRDYGKPMLRSPHEPDLEFNVSHSGDWAVIAVGWRRRIGVDIETIDPRLDGESLAERFFSEQERQALFSLPANCRRRGFYRLWTSKEAYLKALGAGMSLPLGEFSMSADPDSDPGLIGGEIRGGPWCAAGFHAAADTPGVVMWSDGPTAVHLWDAADAW